MPRGVNLSTSAEVRPRGFIFRSGEPAPEPSPRVRLGSCDERSTEALVEAGSAVVIGLVVLTGEDFVLDLEARVPASAQRCDHPLDVGHRVMRGIALGLRFGLGSTSRPTTRA